MGGTFAASRKPLIQPWQSVKQVLWRASIHGRHIYKQIWRPLVGEILTLEREEGNNHDKFAVSLLKYTTVPCMFLKSFSRVLWHFLRHGETTTCEVTDRRKRGKATFAALVRFVLCTGWQVFAQSSFITPNMWWVKPSIKYVLNKYYALNNQHLRY